MGANAGAVDHLDIPVVRGANGVHKAVPHASLPPSDEAVVAGGVGAIALGLVTPRRA